MIIHSVAPLQMLQYNQEIPQSECKKFKDGYIVGNNCAEGFRINRVISTNPAVYLDEKLAIGSIYKENN